MAKLVEKYSVIQTATYTVLGRCDTEAEVRTFLDTHRDPDGGWEGIVVVDLDTRDFEYAWRIMRNIDSVTLFN